MRDIIQVMPAVALRGMTILPDMIVHFDVSRSKSKKAVERAMTTNQKLFVVTQRDPDIEEPEKEELFTVGTIVTVKQMTKLQHGILRQRSPQITIQMTFQIFQKNAKKL